MRTHLRSFAVALAALACTLGIAAQAGFIVPEAGKVTLIRDKKPARNAYALENLQVGDKIVLAKHARATITLYGAPSCNVYKLGTAITVEVAAGGRLLNDKSPVAPSETIPRKLAPDLPLNTQLRGTTIRSGPGATFSPSGALRNAPETLVAQILPSWLSDKTQARVWVYDPQNGELFDSKDVPFVEGRTPIPPKLFPPGQERRVQLLLAYADMADGARKYSVVVLTEAQLKKVEAFDSWIDEARAVSADQKLVLRIRFYLANGLVWDAREALARDGTSIPPQVAKQLRELIDLTNQSFQVLK